MREPAAFFWYNSTTLKQRKIMAWKNINQRTFADELFIEHDAIKELDGLNELIDWSSIEQLLRDIHNYLAGNKS